MTDLNDHIGLYHTHGLWVPDRRIYLQVGDDESLDHTTAAALIKNIHILESQDKTPITVVINCPGGSEIDAYGIYDVIAGSDCRMVGVVVGEASSAATIVLQAFDHRKAYRNTYFLLHDGSNSVSGSQRDVERQVDAAREWRLKYYHLLGAKTHHDSAWWSRKLQHDFILNAGTALSTGLIDEII